MKKYELTSERISHHGRTLFRIRALYDFHTVKKGELGGFVETEENLSHESRAWIGGEAKVYDKAKVFGEALVYDFAEVYGNAKVFAYGEVHEHAKVYENATVFNKANVYGKAKIYGEAVIFDKAEVYGEAEVFEKAQVLDKAKAFDNAVLKGEAILYFHALASGSALLEAKDKVGYGEATTSLKVDLKEALRLTFGLIPSNDEVILATEQKASVGDVLEGAFGLALSAESRPVKIKLGDIETIESGKVLTKKALVLA